MDFSSVLAIVQNIEGPYKWYVIGGVIVVLTLFFTRFVFKTIKWFLLLVAIAVLLFAIVSYFFTA